MLAEGYSFYETPVPNWLSHCLTKLHRRGGKAVLIKDYLKDMDDDVENLMARLTEINNNNGENQINW